MPCSVSWLHGTLNIWTWLSGFALLVVTYYWSADLFFIDRAVLDVGVATAAGISLGTLVAAWLGYEAGRDRVDSESNRPDHSARKSRLRSPRDDVQYRSSCAGDR